MGKRKITKAQVDAAYKMAGEAKQRVDFSLRRARQLKDGADKLRKDYKATLPAKTYKNNMRQKRKQNNV